MCSSKEQTFSSAWSLPHLWDYHGMHAHTPNISHCNPPLGPVSWGSGSSTECLMSILFTAVCPGFRRAHGRLLVLNKYWINGQIRISANSLHASMSPSSYFPIILVLAVKANLRSRSDNEWKELQNNDLIDKMHLPEMIGGYQLTLEKPNAQPL